MRGGARFDTGHLTISWVHNQEGNPRLALVVPRYGGTAVARNLLRRRLREVMRREAMGLIGSTDVVIRARPNAGSTDFETLRAELREWLQSLQR